MALIGNGVDFRSSQANAQYETSRMSLSRDCLIPRNKIPATGVYIPSDIRAAVGVDFLVDQ